MPRHNPRWLIIDIFNCSYNCPALFQVSKSGAKAGKSRTGSDNEEPDGGNDGDTIQGIISPGSYVAYSFLGITNNSDGTVVGKASIQDRVSILWTRLHGTRMRQKISAVFMSSTRRILRGLDLRYTSLTVTCMSSTFIGTMIAAYLTKRNR